MDLSNLKPISEESPPLKVCLYAPSGAGKTVLAAGAPKPLLLDVEKGSRSLLNHRDVEDTRVFPVGNFSQVEDVVWEFREKPELADQYETIIVDTMTELQAMNLSAILAEKHRKDSSRNAYTAQMIDYKENTEILRRLVVALCDLPVNVVLVCHATEVKDESDGRIYIRPAMTPKLAQTVKGLMDIQAYLETEVDNNGKATRTLRTQPGARIDAKSRIGHLPAIIENPTFEMLMKANVDTGKDE